MIKAIRSLQGSRDSGSPVTGATLLFARGPFTPPFRVPLGNCHGHAWAHNHRSAQKHTRAQKKALSFGGPKLLSILLNFIKLLVDSHAQMSALARHRLNSINFTRERDDPLAWSQCLPMFSTEHRPLFRSQSLSMFLYRALTFPAPSIFINVLDSSARTQPTLRLFYAKVGAPTSSKGQAENCGARSA